jgi:hypothetical protein
VILKLQRKGENKMDAKERGAAVWGFKDWLKKNAGEKAAEAYGSIIAAEAVGTGLSGFPEDQLTDAQKNLIKEAEEELAGVATWLKAEGCYGKEHN